MRPHKINITPSTITIDGMQLLQSDECPSVETLAPDLYRVNLTVYASRVQIRSDSHDEPETTPIYDQLKEEA